MYSSALNFVQSTPAATWTVNHTFLGAPLCDVLVPDGNGAMIKILPAGVTYVSDTQLLITFTVPRSGTARLIGRSQSPLVFTAGSVDPGQAS
jgi:hypothetical protein